MLVALLAGAALGKGVLVVDMLAISRYDGGWRKIEPEKTDPVSRLSPLRMWRLEYGKVYGAYDNLKLDLMTDAAQGWYLADSDKASMVLWSGEKPALPAVQRLSTVAPAYLAIVQAQLKAKGLKTAKARIQQIFSVDLDGDGTKEVLIEASSKADLTEETAKATPKDYTTIILRYVGAKGPVTKVIAHNDGRKGMLEGVDRIRAIADLNGDGVSEVILSSNYYEGSYASVWNFKKGKLKKLVDNGAGV